MRAASSLPTDTEKPKGITVKLKALALALFVAGVCSSFALADDGHGKGQKSDDAATGIVSARCSVPSAALSSRSFLSAVATASRESSRVALRRCSCGSATVCRATEKFCGP